MPVTTINGRVVSHGNCGTGAGGFKPGNQCAKGGTGQARAKAGGEEGPNGEWYPGGAFIATTEMPKKFRAQREKAAKGRKEIEPYKYEVPPAGKLPIYANLGPGVALTLNGRDPANWSINETYLYQSGGDAETVSQANGMLDRFRSGERFVDANEFHQFVTYDDAARMAIAGIPMSGASLERMARIRGVTVEELQTTLGMKRYAPPA